MTENYLIYIIILIAALLIIFFLTSTIRRLRGRGRVVRALSMSLFLIKLPREAKEDISIDEKKAPGNDSSMASLMLF